MNPYKLLDLIPNEKGGPMKSERSHVCCADDKKLELRLGLPGDEQGEERRDGLVVSLGYFPCATNTNHGGGGGSSSNRNNSGSGSSQDQKQQQTYPTTATPWGYAKESSQHCYSSMMDLAQGSTDMQNKAFPPPSSACTAVPNTSQKRAAPAPVVGWPPIRTFRKNLASTNAGKAAPDPLSTKAKEKTTENCNKGLFVKINMDGVPIGRKVDLSVYDSYEKLSSAVDGLFRGLLAAQNDSSACGTKNIQEEKAITGLLDGSGEYTLVYEDNEGDRMLAGDVPWHMFVSTVKRLRVLKSSELSTLNKVEGRVRKLPNE